MKLTESHLRNIIRQELKEMIADMSNTDLHEAADRDELKQKLKSYLGSKPSGVSISTLATKFGVSEKEIKGAARSEGLSVQDDKVMFRKPI